MTDTGLTEDQIRDEVITDDHVSPSAGIQESKLLFNSAGHAHTGGADGALISGVTVDPIVVDAAFTGDIDGANDTYTMPDNFVADTVAVYRGGIRQKRGVHFTESAPNQIVMAEPPPTGATLVFDYRKS
jgi:hypothetical protein